MSAKLQVKKAEKGPNLVFNAWPMCRIAILFPSVMAALAVCISMCCNVFCTAAAPCCLAAVMRPVMDVFSSAARCKFAWNASKSLSVALASTRMSSAKAALCFWKKIFVVCSTWIFRTVSAKTAANSGVFHLLSRLARYLSTSDSRWYSSSSLFMRYRKSCPQLIFARLFRFGAQSP